MSKSAISSKLECLQNPESNISKNKRPLREATTIGHLLRISPNRINSFLQRSQKWVGTQNIELLLIFTSRNQLFTENRNGPYGPYEQLLKDGKGNYRQKTSYRPKVKFMGESEILKNQF